MGWLNGRVAKAAAVMIAAGLALTGCGTSGSKSGAAASNKASDAKVEIRFMWWGNDTRNAMTMKVIEAYQAANPNVTIKAEPTDWGSYWDKLATMAAGGNAPDVIQMDEKYIADYGTKGVLLDLEKAGVKTDGFAPGTIDLGRVKGKLYGVNAGINAPVVLANPKVLTAAGATVPDDKTWTWDQLNTLAKNITEKSPAGTYGSQNYGAVEPMLRVYLRQNGQDEYSDAGVGFDAPLLGKWFENMQAQTAAKAFPSAAEATEDMGKALDQTMAATNKAGLFYYWSNQVSALDKATGQDLKVLRPPSTTGNAKDAQLWYKASMYWSGYGKTKNAAEVAKFISYLSSNVEAGKVMGTERGVPANLAVREAVKGQLSASDKKVVAYLDAIDSERGKAPAITPVGGSDIQLGRYTQDVLFNKSTPAKAAEGLVNELKSKVKV